MIKNVIHKNLVYLLSLIALLYIVLVVFVSAYYYLSVIENVYKGVLLFTLNVAFLFMIFGLIVWIIHDLFLSGEKHNDLIKSLLIFVTALILFSRIQEFNLTWGVNDQFFAACFFTLLTFYLFTKLLLNKSQVVLFGAVLSGIVSVVIIYSMDIIYVSNPSSDVSVIESFEFMKYFLTYLGGVFYYISGKECISTAVLAGLFMLGTLLYMSYLSFIKKDTNPLYLAMLAFLYFYTVLALVTVRNELLLEIHHMYKHQYITISLMAWSLLIIFYVHLFKENEKILNKIFILGITLSVFLIGYQFTIYKSNTKDFLYKKTAAFVLEMEIKDIQYTTAILNNADVSVKGSKERTKDKKSMFEPKDINFEMVMEQSNEFIKENLSVLEYENIKDIIFKIGTNIDHFPQKDLVGYLERSILIGEKKNTLRIHGWVYDTHKKRVPAELYVVDQTNKTVGYVFTGDHRGDVRKIYGKRSLHSGFIGYIFDVIDSDKLFLVDIKSKKKLEIKLPKDMSELE